MTEMWQDFAGEIEAEAANRGVAYAIASVGGFEPYVSIGSSVADFENRLAMIAQPIEASVLDATGDPAMVAVATEHLRTSWKTAFEERQRTAAAKVLAGMNDCSNCPHTKSEHGGDGPCDACIDEERTDKCGGFYNKEQSARERNEWYKYRAENVTYTDGTKVKEGDHIRYHQAPGGLMPPGDWVYGVAARLPKDRQGGDTINELHLLGDDGRYYGIFGHVIERAEKPKTGSFQKGAVSEGDVITYLQPDWNTGGPGKVYRARVNFVGVYIGVDQMEPPYSRDRVHPKNVQSVESSGDYPVAPHSSAKTASEPDNDFDPNTWHAHEYGEGFKTKQVDGVTVHTFDSTAQGYNHSQTSDKIKDGDVLSVPSEGVHGFLYQAWPVASTTEHGEFHGADVDGLLGENPQYRKAHEVAKTLGKTSGRDAALGAFFHHDKPTSGGGTMGEQSEWDAAAAAARARKKQVSPVTTPVHTPDPRLGEEGDPSKLSSIDDLTSVEFVEAHLLIEGGFVGDVMEHHHDKKQRGFDDERLTDDIVQDAFRGPHHTDEELGIPERYRHSSLAFNVDKGGRPMTTYGPTRPKAEEAPAGSRTFHVDLPPGSGQGSFEHEKEVSEEYDPRHHRRAMMETEAGFIDRLHRHLQREQANGNLTPEEAKIHARTVQLVNQHQQERKNDQQSDRHHKEYFEQHPKEKGQYERIAAGQHLAYDPDAMFPSIPADKRPYPCPECGLWRNAENCPHCDADDTRFDDSIPRRGPTFVDWLMHGLLPSGAMAAKTAESDYGYDVGECRICGGRAIGQDGRWFHDPRFPLPVHPDGSVAGDAHGVVPKTAAANPKMSNSDYAAGYKAGQSDASKKVRFNLSNYGEKSSNSDFAEGYYDGFDGETALPKEAVNEQAWGSERYQSQPTEGKRPEWAQDEWDQPGQKAPWGYFPGPAGGKYRDGMSTTGAEFHDQPGGQADEFAHLRTPVTTRPRVQPHPSPTVEHTQPSIYPDSPSGSGGFGGDTGAGAGMEPDSGSGSDLDFSSPTFEQQAAAKLSTIAHRVVDDNPHLSMEQGRLVALETLSSHPEMLAVNSSVQATAAAARVVYMQRQVEAWRRQHDGPPSPEQVRRWKGEALFLWPEGRS